MKSPFRIPDYMLYGIIVASIVIFSNIKKSDDFSTRPPEKIGALLPNDNPRDPNVFINIDPPTSSTGTAFAIDESGKWLTARHVVDGCDNIALLTGSGKALKVSAETSTDSDLALLSGKWTRSPIRSDIYSPRYLGEYGYFFGFPQGRPGEAVGRLLGRAKMNIRHPYNTSEPILAWAESGRSSGLKGSLGGLSGAPVLDKDGEIISVVSAENLRRGRVYSIAPRKLRAFVKENKAYKARPIAKDSYGLQADEYRRNRQISQVICLVK